MFRQMFEEKYIRFPEGKTRALTFSYDDGVEADKKLVAIFDKYGLKGTFNLNSSLFECRNWHDRMNEKETIELFKNSRHEVALHGARHIFMNKVPVSEALYETVKCREYLENKFERIVRGHAYAYNGYNDEIVEMLKMAGVSYSRTTEPSYSFDIPKDFLRLKPTCHHGDKKLYELSDKFFKTSPSDEFKNREGRLFIVWGHSYEFDDNNNWEIIENLGKRAKECADLWNATLGEVVDYIKSYDNLVFSLDGERVYNPSCNSVWIELRGKTYEVKPGKNLVFDADL